MPTIVWKIENVSNKTYGCNKVCVADILRKHMHGTGKSHCIQINSDLCDELDISFSFWRIFNAIWIDFNLFFGF